MEEAVIRCPKCNSSQIVANKKGFSGKKAVAGAILTGGIGILAGTIGSKDIIITCLACGHEFKPGDASLIKSQETVQKEALSHFESVQRAQRGEKAEEKPVATEGCFVATACYGDYDAPEVIELRKFRDLKLARNYWGRVFIKTYYSISPSIAAWISQSKFIKKVVRKLVLNPIIKLVKIEEN